jgi:flagellar biogenesis protein FliO
LLLATGLARAQDAASHYARGLSQPAMAPSEYPAAPQTLNPAAVYDARPLDAAPHADYSTSPPLPLQQASAADTAPSGYPDLISAPVPVSTTIPDPAIPSPFPATGNAGATARERAPLRLAPREKSTEPLARPAATSPVQAVSGVAGSLAIVLGLFVVVVWLSRRYTPAGQAKLPGEVVEMLGRAPLAARQQMQLVRLGSKLVLLNVTATGAEALAEVTDPAEVERLVALCRRGQPGSSSASFNQLLAEVGSEPAAPGFVGNGVHTPARTPQRRS